MTVRNLLQVLSICLIAQTVSANQSGDDALDLLAGTCPDIRQYQADILSAEIQQTPPSVSAQRDYGWTHQTTVKVVISNQPAVIPKEYHAQGQRCYFDLGGKSQNIEGLAVSKRACNALCGNVGQSFMYYTAK
ncbi:MAG: hypothetical protein CMI13_11205 [Oleibacter sp.]|nr:hypothetical protein [Thalassolituus sp.]|tara:strand:- start:128 stop:526 length:399 start_codon:yes stop_codon:yes gene_type:complete